MVISSVFFVNSIPVLNSSPLFMDIFVEPRFIWPVHIVPFWGVPPCQAFCVVLHEIDHMPA